MSRKSYSELITLPTFEERYGYLRLHGGVAKATFGFNRGLNQLFYSSSEWQTVRNEVIVRDNACDLGIAGYDLYKVYIHHINPITIEDIREFSSSLLDPNNLICCSLGTHNAIHFGVHITHLPKNSLSIRKKGDTKIW